MVQILRTYEIFLSIRLREKNRNLDAIHYHLGR